MGVITATSLCSCSVPASGLISGEESLSSLPEESSLPEPEPVPEPEPEPPKPEIILSATEVERGSFMLVRIENYDGESIEYKDFLGYDRSFFEYEGGWLSLIPVKTAAKAGNYVLSIILDGERFDNEVTVTDRAFDEQYLTPPLRKLLKASTQETNFMKKPSR